MNPKKFTYFFLLTLLNINYLTAQKSNTLIELKASGLYQDKPTTNYSILIYENGILKDSVFQKKTKALTIAVEANKVYSIVFKKDSGPNKVVIVNTALPSHITDFEQDPFELQVELSNDNNPLKKEFQDHPIVVLSINSNKRLLMASEEYLKLTRN